VGGGWAGCGWPRDPSLGDVQAFIQYSRQFTQPIGPDGRHANVLQSTARLASGVFEVLDEAEEEPRARTASGCSLPPGVASRWRNVSFRYLPTPP